MCPRCGGDLSSASRHRAEMQDRARRTARRVVATGAGVVLAIVALAVWLVIGARVAHGDEKPMDRAPEKSVFDKPAADKTAVEKPAADKAAVEKTEKTAADKTAADKTDKPARGDKIEKAPRVDKKLQAAKLPKGADKSARPIEGGVALDNIESTLSPRPVRVRLLDGSTVIGTVHTEEPATLVIDCSLGQLAIPRTRISTISYDSAAGIGQKRAPVQQLDDEDKPTKKRAAQP
ncbi:MAG: hypothetical protein JWN44_3637 [Myxococcales bacterium]|nr:hypothetical protein [Myxococcales bacterium]